MKKTSKILLSALAISSMFFTMTVNAEEQATTTPQEETQVQTTSMGTELFESITKEKFDSIVPNTIDVTITKNDFANSIISSSDNMDYAKIINEEVQAKIITLFRNSGYMDTEEAEKETIKAAISDPWVDFYTIYVSLNIGGKQISSKAVTINYAKESNFNVTDETYVKNKVNGIKFANFEGNDAVITTTYNVENAWEEWIFDTYDFNKLLNDNSITIKKNFSPRSSIGGYTILFFYKNDVLYDVKSVMHLVMYGTTLENGTPVGMSKIYDTDNTYKEMAKELENKGYTNILGAYELTAYGQTYDNMKVSFNLGSDNNGKEVIILHKKKDNTYETFTTTVADGKAEITVSEFSPFMIALSNNNTTTENVNNAPNNAQTSSIDIVLYSILAIGSSLGITYIVVKNRKKVA